MIEIYYNGVWNEWKPAGMQKFDFISNTVASDWILTNMKHTYDSGGTIPKMTFTGITQAYNGSQTPGTENGQAICKVPIMIKKNDKLKITSSGSNTGGNWSSLVAGTDGIKFPYTIFGEVLPYNVNKEIDLTTYAGSELYFKYCLRVASIYTTATLTRFEISQ